MMLIKEIDISRFITHAYQIEKERVKQSARENMRAKRNNVDYYQ